MLANKPTPACAISALTERGDDIGAAVRSKAWATARFTADGSPGAGTVNTASAHGRGVHGKRTTKATTNHRKSILATGGQRIAVMPLVPQPLTQRLIDHQFDGLILSGERAYHRTRLST